MGNHTAGALINSFAVQFAKNRHPNEPAIDILDKAVREAKAIPGFSTDAEFEAVDPYDKRLCHPVMGNWTDPHPAAVLGLLMVEAFAPNGLRDLHRYSAALGTPTRWRGNEEAERLANEADDLWWKEVYHPFKERYGLC